MNNLEMFNVPLETPQSCLQRSQRFLELGKVNFAIDELKKALAIDDNFVSALSKLATIYQQQQQFDLALKCYQRIVALEPTNHHAYAKLCGVLMVQDRIKDAILVYKKSLSLPDTPVFICSGLADALEQDNQLKAAMAVCTYTLKLFPDHLKITTTLARCIAKQKQLESSLIDRRSEQVTPLNNGVILSEIEPQNVQPYSYFFQRGRELLSAGDYDEAIAVYTAGNKQHSDHPFSYFMLGNAYSFIHDCDRELECYRQAIQLDLSNFKQNIEDTDCSRSTLNDNQIKNTYQKIVEAAIKARQTSYLLQLLEIASQRLKDYSFFFETTQKLAKLEFNQEAIAFLEQAKVKGMPLYYFDSEHDEIQNLLPILRQFQNNATLVNS